MSDQTPEDVLQAAFPFVRVVVSDEVSDAEFWLLPTVEQAERWLDRARRALDTYRAGGGKALWVEHYQDRIGRVERSLNWYAHAEQSRSRMRKPTPIDPNVPRRTRQDAPREPERQDDLPF
jgi:hypothetical protein